MLVKISGSFRIKRGGSWYGYASYCEVTYRYNSYPYLRLNDIGFRVLRRYNNVNKD